MQLLHGAQGIGETRIVRGSIDRHHRPPGRGQPAPERLQVAALTLDCIRRKVNRAAEPIDLAPKEFGILEYMMRNKGRPLSRTMIVEHVWDMDYDGLTNIVDVYIRHLRSKIDDRFTQKLIHTVRGIGYMIEAPVEKPPEAPTEPPAEPTAEPQA